MTRYRALHINSIDYQNGFALQKILQQQVLSSSEEQYILMLEHPHVFTTGKRGFGDHLKHPETFFHQLGIDLIQTDRGGLVTYHGPGQLVIYFIIDLTTLSLSIKQFVTHLETTIIQTLKQCGIVAKREPEYRGIFVGEDKICAIGMQQTRQVTTHGIALNINTNLKYFNWITPCGIDDKGVTSINHLIKDEISQKNIIDIFLNQLETTLEITIERT